MDDRKPPRKRVFREVAYLLDVPAGYLAASVYLAIEAGLTGRANPLGWFCTALLAGMVLVPIGWVVFLPATLAMCWVGSKLGVRSNLWFALLGLAGATVIVVPLVLPYIFYVNSEFTFGWSILSAVALAGVVASLTYRWLEQIQTQ